MSTDPSNLVQQAAEYIRQTSQIDDIDIAMVLGSGWSGATNQLGDTLAQIQLETIPGFRAPAVAGHGGDLGVLELESGKKAGVLTGRTHFYESRDVMAVVHGVRTVAALGAKTLVLTNGCGGLNPQWGPGTVVAIRDHINLTGETPLRGPEFIDMTDTWSGELIDLVRSVDPTIDTGVYAQFAGPQYETPAEVKFASIIGADLVGMSTALEAIAARAAGMRILGLSLVTNLAAGLSHSSLDHHEVIEAGRNASERLAGLLADIARRL